MQLACPLFESKIEKHAYQFLALIIIMPIWLTSIYWLFLIVLTFSIIGLLILIRRLTEPCTAIEYTNQGWRIKKYHSWYHVHTHGQALVTPHLIVLPFLLPNRHHCTVYIFPDSIHPIDFHRLRLKLLLEPFSGTMDKSVSSSI